MRLGFFDDRFHMTYGAQRNVLLLAELAVSRGHDVIVYTTAEGAFAVEARRRGLDVHVVEAPIELRTFERGAVSQGFSHMVRTGYCLFRYGRRLSTELRRDNRQLLVAAAVRPALLSMRWRLGRGGKLVLYAQNNTPFGSFAALAGMVSDRVGLIGPEALRTFPRWSQRFLRRRCRPLASGRDLDAFRIENRRQRAPSEVFEVLSIAAIERRKGLHLLIDALSGIPNDVRLRLTVVGGPSGAAQKEYLAELRAQASTSGIDVEFVGWQQNVLPFLAAADLFVLASLEEGLPGVLIEAMASGLACVTTSAGNAGALVHGCNAGSVVAVGDVEGLRNEIEMFARDRDACYQVGQRAALEVQGQYDLEAFVDRFEDLLQEFEEDAG